MSEVADKPKRNNLTGLKRDEKGRILRKSFGTSPRGASALIKQRFGKLIYKVLKEELTEEKLKLIVRQMVKIGCEYPDHKDAARVGEFLMRLGTDPDRANENATQNINITLNTIRENASAQQAFLNLKPISVQIVEKHSGDAGRCDPAVVRELPAPVPDATPER